MEHLVWNLAKPTPGDDNFLKRWSRVGRTAIEVDEAPHVTVLVVDQHSEFRLMLPNLPSLKYICSATTGHTHLEGLERDYTLITLRGEKEFLSGVWSVAEYTMRLMLTLARPTTGYGHLLRGKGVGIVGYGRIGKQVKALAESFGMAWQAWDRGSSLKNLEIIFEAADFITIHLEENEQTKGLIGHDLIDLMKPSAYLINTARPSIVDEDYAERAASEGKIAGFASDFPGHWAGSTIEDRVRTDEFLVEKTLRVMSQELESKPSRWLSSLPKGLRCLRSTSP